MTNHCIYLDYSKSKSYTKVKKFLRDFGKDLQNHKIKY